MEYNLAKNNSCLEILGKKFSLESIKELLYILEQIKKDKNLSECKITGNFDTYFQTKDFLKKNSISEIKKVLSLFQLITKTIEKSHINFVCEVNSTMQGPALELALSCNMIKANSNVVLKFEEADNGAMPLFGSIQRLLRIIGYKNTLDTLLMKKFLSYKDAENLKIINYNNNNQERFKKKKNFSGINLLLIHLFFIILNYMLRLKINCLLIMPYFLVFMRELYVDMKQLYLLKRDGCYGFSIIKAL